MLSYVLNRCDVPLFEIFADQPGVGYFLLTRFLWDHKRHIETCRDTRVRSESKEGTLIRTNRVNFGIVTAVYIR